jgi:hypothetical protein
LIFCVIKNKRFFEKMSEWALIKKLEPVTAFLKKKPDSKKFLLKALRSNTGKKLQLGSKLQALAEENGHVENLLLDVFEEQGVHDKTNVATFCKSLMNRYDQYLVSKEDQPAPFQTPGKQKTNHQLKLQQEKYPSAVKVRVEKQKFTSQDVATGLAQLNQNLENISESKSKSQKVVNFSKSLEDDVSKKQPDDFSGKKESKSVKKLEPGDDDDKPQPNDDDDDDYRPQPLMLNSGFNLDESPEGSFLGNDSSEEVDMGAMNKKFFEQLSQKDKSIKVGKEKLSRNKEVQEMEGQGQKRPVYDSLPVESNVQKAFDNVNFDLFSHVVPGFGNGVDNKLFRMDVNRKRKIEWQDPMYLPRPFDGPEQGVAPFASQFKNVMGISDINEFIAYKDYREKKDTLYKSRNKIVSVLPGEPFYQPSSKGLPTRRMSNYVKVIDNRTPLMSQDLPCGMYLKKPRITAYDPCVNLENHAKPKFNKLSNLYAYQTVNGLNWMQ